MLNTVTRLAVAVMSKSALVSRFVFFGRAKEGVGIAYAEANA